jgi:hypothetical protein
VVLLAIMAGVEEVKVVVAHRERATLRVGDVFLKIEHGGFDPFLPGCEVDVLRARM